LIKRTLAKWHYLLRCAPAYLETRSAPRRPADLADHNCPLYAYSIFGTEFPFIDPAGIPVSARVLGKLVSTSIAVLRTAAAAGLGFVIVSPYIVSDLLASRALVPLLPDYRTPELEIVALYPHRRHLSSFGRRANAGSDYIVEAVSIAKALGANGTPVKLQWTREDDVRGGLYRPAYVHKLEAGLDARGQLVAWRHRIVGQSIMAGTPFAQRAVKDGVDRTSVEGAANLPYAIPNLAVELTTTESPVPVLWWRVVGSSHTAYAVEDFIDEVAETAGQDPYRFRRALLAGQPRHRAVLDLAAEKAGWGQPLPKGRGRGIAVAEAFHTYVAQVAEVTVGGDGKVKVDRVICAVDCGVAVNPDVIAAQMEGGIGFGLGAALYGAITLKDGQVEQSNFDGYQVLRIDDMPKVEVHIVPSTEAPTGVGEPGVAPIGPAVANAVFAATGKRYRVLPFSSARTA
jgi:isoquinoline 1-oxidoreductase subunit beta